MKKIFRLFLIFILFGLYCTTFISPTAAEEEKEEDELTKERKEKEKNQKKRDEKFNEESLQTLKVFTESHYLKLKDNDEIQFIRFGYCRKESSHQAIFTHK